MSCASAGLASEPAAIRVARINTLRGGAGGLTKSSSDGPAGMPSRLQDFQTRSWKALQRAAAQSAARCGAKCVPAAVPAQPAAQRLRRLAGEAQPRAVGPSRQDSGPQGIASRPAMLEAEAEAVAVAVVVVARRVPACAKAHAMAHATAWALRWRGVGAESTARCAAAASGGPAARHVARGGRSSVPAQSLPGDRGPRAVLLRLAAALRRQRADGPDAGEPRAFEARHGRRARCARFRHRSSR